MTTAGPFLAKFARLITLRRFDRVIFKGHLALAAPSQLVLFVDCALKVRSRSTSGSQGGPHLSLPHRLLQNGSVGRATLP